MMRRHDWSGFTALAAFILMIVAAMRGSMAWAGGWLAVVVVTGVLAGVFVYFVYGAAAGTP